MQGLRIRFRVDSSRLNTEPLTSSDDPEGDFSPVGNQYFLKQKVPPFMLVALERENYN